MEARSTRLEKVIEPTVKAMGFTLWGVDLTQHNQKANLCVFIDSIEGITVDDCAEVSSQIEAVLEVEDVLPRNLTLQVSSPGMDRVLFKPQQFQSYLGEEIDVRLAWPLEGRTHFRGRLNSSDSEGFQIELDAGEINVEFQQLQRARLVPTFE